LSALGKCLERDSNPHGRCWPQDFKSCVSTDFTTQARVFEKAWPRRPCSPRPRLALVSRIRLKRADDEARTRDLNLGKVALYQLSYIRVNDNNFFQNDEARTRDLNLGSAFCKSGTLYQLSYIRVNDNNFFQNDEARTRDLNLGPAFCKSGTLYQLSYIRLNDNNFFQNEEARTRDLNLGPAFCKSGTLYQLSYIRVLFFLASANISLWRVKKQV
jgi:hypothetical protein